MSGQWYEPKTNRNLLQRIVNTLKRINSKRSGSFRKKISKSPVFLKLREKSVVWVLNFGHWFQSSVLPVLRRFNWKLIQGLMAVLVVSFFLANSISTFAANGILSLTRSDGKSTGKKTRVTPADEGGEEMTPGSVALGSPQTANAISLKKEILGRNLFNAEGKLAPEVLKDDQKLVRKDMTLDFEKVECTSAELPVQINGTIFTGDPLKSLAILKDPKIADADIYKPGDAIIDHEDYEIYKVGRGMLEVRKGNSKICVAINGYGKKEGDGGSDFQSPSTAKPAGESKEFEFDAAFISQEIGPGYATILNCAKLIPEIDASGKMQGFKMISIATSCLFDRIQIQNGDVVTEVNGVSLKDPGQGFKLYQSLQEERTTNINILRNGEPITRIIRVK
ncbi:MAG: hypothetical protein RIR26_1477 [Pseudomonadota bacterium]|jgi:type II secretory pathway component PulC